MGETTAEVRRDIELTRERMSGTLDELEHRLNVARIVREHPWPALGLAVGAGILLSGSRADVKAAAAAATATRGASSRVGSLLDDMVATLVAGVNDALQSRVEEWVDELKDSIASPRPRSSTDREVPGGYGVGPIHAEPDDMIKR